MRNFSVNLIKFFIPPVLLLFIPSLIFYHISKSKIDSKLDEVSEYQFLLMGDSQIQRLDGEIISKKTKNISSPGEHYFFTYQKLLSILENKNHKIEKIILGVSIHNFAPVYNRLFDLNFPEGKKSLKRYIYFINQFENSNFITSVNGILKLFIVAVWSTPDWGGFAISTNSMPSRAIIKETHNMHYSIKQNEEEFSYSQRLYLQKIDSLCLYNNINLILVSTPYHSLYKEKIDAKYFDFFTESLRKLKHRTHLNYITDKIDSRFMSDANHLNKLGAKKYSEIIKQEINSQTQK